MSYRDGVAALAASKALSIVAIGLVVGVVTVASQQREEPTDEDESETDCIGDTSADPCALYLANLDRLADSVPEAARRPILESKIDLLKLNAEDPDYVEALCERAVLRTFEQADVPDGICIDERPPPSKCESYVSAMNVLAACAPEESRQSIRDSAKQMMMALRQLPPLSVQQAEDACATALESIDQALEAMHCERLAPQSGFHLIDANVFFYDDCWTRCSAVDD